MSITLRAKRILTGALAGALVLGLLPAGVASAASHGGVCAGAASGTFTDSNPTHQANIDCVAAYGVVTGFANGTFGGSQNITRGQMATFIARFAATTQNVAITDIAIAAHTFTDVAGNVHADNIARVFGLGVTAGRTATTFAPNDTITRAEAATMLANAHVALGVDLTGVTPSTAFTDLGTSVHATNINILAGAGVVSGKTATTFAPSASILRAEAATLLVRSTTVLVAQGKWNAPALGAPVASANIVTSRNGVSPDTVTTFNFSNGSTVTTVAIGADDVFNVDGIPANLAAFSTALTVGDEVVVQKDTPAKDRQTISVTNRANATFYTTGMINNVDTNASSFNIVEPVSGVTLNPVANYAAALTTYQVDGAAATLAQFEAAINDGDVVTIGGTSSARVYSLSNLTVTGKVAVITVGASLTVTTSVGLTLSTTFIPDTTDDVVVLDGVTQAKANNATSLTAAAVRVGDTVSVSRNADVLTISVIRVALPTVSGVVVEQLNGAPTTLAEADGTLVTIVGLQGTISAATYKFFVDGVAVTEAVFNANATAGDAISIQQVDGEVIKNGSAEIRLTNQNLSGKVVQNTAGTSINVVLASSTAAVQTVTGVVYGDGANPVVATADTALYGNVDPSQFRVNGATRTAAQFAASMALIAEGTNTGTIVISDAGSFTLFDMTVTAAPAATFTVAGSANDNEITITFNRPVRYEAASAAGDFVIKVAGATVTTTFSTNNPTISPDTHALTIVFDANIGNAGTGNLSVELTSAGAAKIKDKNGTAAAAQTVTGDAV